MSPRFPPSVPKPSTASKLPAESRAPAAPSAEALTEGPLGELLQALTSALHLKRREVVDRCRELELALAAYRGAVESTLAADFARDHAFRAPSSPALSPRASAQRLQALVAALPELSDAPEERPAASPPDASTPVSAPRAAALDDEAHPHLAALSGNAKLVVVGALAGRQRDQAVPEHLPTEWIDTESDGVHAIGNLPQRIRQGRVAGLVILDKAVQHKHTEPAVSAARAANVPVGFAGKGGVASIRRAVEQIEKQLHQRHRPR